MPFCIEYSSAYPPAIEPRCNDFYEMQMEPERLDTLKFLMKELMNKSLSDAHSMVKEIGEQHRELRFLEQYTLEMPILLRRWTRHAIHWSTVQLVRWKVDADIKDFVYRLPSRKAFEKLDVYTKCLVMTSRIIWSDFQSLRLERKVKRLFHRTLWDYLSQRINSRLPSMHTIFEFGDEAQSDYLKHLVNDCGLMLNHVHHLEADVLWNHHDYWYDLWSQRNELVQNANSVKGDFMELKAPCYDKGDKEWRMILVRSDAELLMKSLDHMDSMDIIPPDIIPVVIECLRELSSIKSIVLMRRLLVAIGLYDPELVSDKLLAIANKLLINRTTS